MRDRTPAGLSGMWQRARVVTELTRVDRRSGSAAAGGGLLGSGPDACSEVPAVALFVATLGEVAGDSAAGDNHVDDFRVGWNRTVPDHLGDLLPHWSAVVGADADGQRCSD